MGNGDTGNPGEQHDPPGDACQHQPADGTLRTRTGLPASLEDRDDFPVEALCANCSRPIRRQQYEVTRPDGGWRLKDPELWDRFAAFRARHPEVHISDSGQSAAWFGDDGPYTAFYDSPLRMIGYLEARFR